MTDPQKELPVAYRFVHQRERRPMSQWRNWPPDPKSLRKGQRSSLNVEIAWSGGVSDPETIMARLYSVSKEVTP
jgi:hypothetical protein